MPTELANVSVALRLWRPEVVNHLTIHFITWTFLSDIITPQDSEQIKLKNKIKLLKSHETREKEENLTCSRETSIGSLNTIQMTDSLNGGVVNEPKYVQYA